MCSCYHLTHTNQCMKNCEKFCNVAYDLTKISNTCIDNQGDGGELWIQLHNQTQAL